MELQKGIMPHRLSCPILATLLLLSAGAAEHLAQNEAELLAAATSAKPGDQEPGACPRSA